MIDDSQGTFDSATINPVFDNQFVEVTDTGFEWTAFVLSDPVPSGSSVFVGEFLFNATGPGTATIDIADLLPGSGSEFVNTLSGAGTELDELIFGTGGTEGVPLSIIVTAPEPHNVFILSGLSLVSLRRTRKKQMDQCKKS